jgi:tetratricopeptide (TPR) repeat protein
MGATVSSTELKKAEADVLQEPSREEGKLSGDEFLNFDDLGGFKQDAAKRCLKQAVADIEELIRESKWEDAVSLFHPVEDKFPELMIHDLDIGLREKVAFALGHLKKYDEAISQLDLCLRKDPENFHLHASMAYTAYDSLYAAKNREIFLAGKLREQRIRLAHRHFDAARHLRPDGVTNAYRQGMLYRQIENKPDPALPLFAQAVENWDRLEPVQQEARHQEKKNFIKALFQLSGSLLEIGKPEKALPYIKRCLVEDEKTNYLSLCFKYFALGKVNFHLRQFNPAKDALLFALQCDGGQSPDFVCELLGRMGTPFAYLHLHCFKA